MHLAKNTSRILFLTFCCFCLAIANTSISRAFDEDFYSSNDILFYNPEASVCGQGADSGAATSSVTIDTSDNLQAFLEYFTGKGFSLASAAGMAGNIRQESNFNPAVIQGGAIAKDDYNPVNGTKGFGLAQWTSSGRQQNLVNFAKSKNKPITDLGMQLDFMWKEMNDGAYKDMLAKLNANTSDPVAAAAVFHGLTPNIEREGGSINPKFKASGAAFGYERSGDTSDTVIKVRGGAAAAYYQKYQGKIADGTGVSGATAPTDESGEIIAPACNADTSTSTDLGVGDGNFTDSGEVAGWDSVLYNSTAADRLFGDRLEGDGWCASIVSRTWRGKDIGYGVHYAVTLWDNNKSNGKGHADRSPKKGAILIYRSDTQAAGHVTIYLGDNKILNDGKIRDANYVEKGGWGLHYLGWIDPNELGWTTTKADDAYFKTTLSRYDE